MDRDSQSRAFGAFCLLWAIAALAEHGFAIRPVADPANAARAVCIAVAAWALLAPRSIGRFLVLVSVQAATLVIKMPVIPNHGLLVLAVDAAILLGALRLRFAGPRMPLDRGELYATFAPLLRWQLLALYFWAVWHKLNAGFFDPELSCAMVQSLRLSRMLPIVPFPEWARVPAIAGTLLIEAAIPLMLVFGRTRLAGLVLAGTFHFVLGFSYPSFSATLFALFCVFLPAPLLARLCDLARLRRRLTVVLPLVLIASAACLVWGSSMNGARVAWMAYGLGVLLLLLGESAATSPWAAASPSHPLALRFKSLAFVPLLLFLNGANPYLGLKNTQSFAMYSNLRTGDGKSNHLIVPASWQVWDYQRDLVTIHESSDPVLRHFATPFWSNRRFSSFILVAGDPRLDGPPPRWDLPYFALRTRVTQLARSGERNVRLTYTRDGETRTLSAAETDPELSSVSWPAYKLLYLRGVPDDDRGYCMW